MKVSDNKYVSLVYELRYDGEAGDMIEVRDDNNPFNFVYGSGMMLPKFEENLLGLEAGNNFKFALDAQDAYGEYNEDAVVDIPKKNFMIDGKIDENALQIDKEISMSDKSGNNYRGVIIEIEEEIVSVDFNHPLAGETLFFSGKLLEIRPATEDEIQAGIIECSGGCDCCESCK